MATYEYRKNAAGKIVAVRAKVRRVGLPHLSKTFPVDPAADELQLAEAAARQWVSSLSASLRNSDPGVEPVPGRAQRGSLAALWRNQTRTSPAEPRAGLSKAEVGSLLGVCVTPLDQALVALILETGLLENELERLRWQHIQVAERSLEIVGPSGLLSRRLPLSIALLDRLLSLEVRKYGLIFRGGGSWIKDRVRRLAEDAELGDACDLRKLRVTAAESMLAAKLSPEEVAARLGIHSLQQLLPSVGATPPTPGV